MSLSNSIQLLTGSNKKIFSNLPLNTEIDVTVVRKLDNGMFLINMRGNNYQLPIKGELEPGKYKAILKKQDSGEGITIELKKSEGETKDIINTKDVLQNQKAKIRVSSILESLKFTDKIKVTDEALLKINTNKTDIDMLVPGDNTEPENNVANKVNENILKLKLKFIDAFQKGAEINLKIIKPTSDKNSFLVRVDDFEFEVKIEPPPRAGEKELLAKIVKSFPNPELKPVNKEVLTDDKISKKLSNENFSPETKQIVKKELLSLKKESLNEIIKTSPKLTLNEFTPSSIEKVIKESGNFFENKLMNNITVTEDAKFDAIKNANIPLKDSIVKLQLFNSVINSGAFSFFNFEDDGLRSGEMQIRKTGEGFSVNIKMDFSQIGETFVKIVSYKGRTDVVVSSEKDISDRINSLKIPGLNVHWKAITKKDKEEFDIEKKIMSNFSGLNILI